jgi:hypothetical protein
VIYVIFFIVSIILFIVGSSVILFRRDKGIGSISLVGALIYFALATLMLNSNFEIEKINREAYASRVNASSGNVAVSGNVLPVKSSSTAAPRYVKISVLPIQNISIQQVEVVPIVSTNTTPVVTQVSTNTASIATSANTSKNQNRGKIIGDTDSKIYHEPGSTYYERELQKTSNNVYFDTVEEAEAAGYRAPKR